MVNPSKTKDRRFWLKWRASGAVSSGNKHFDRCMASSARFELKGQSIEAGLMRVAAYNDYAHWKSVPKPPLGEVILLHQAYEGTEQCLYCGTPIQQWSPIEKCSARYDPKVA